MHEAMPLRSRSPRSMRPAIGRVSSRAADEGPPDAAREDVIQEEMQLRLDSDAASACAVDGNDGLDAQLHLASGPEQAGIDGARPAPVIDPIERLFRGDL